MRKLMSIKVFLLLSASAGVLTLGYLGVYTPKPSPVALAELRRESMVVSLLHRIADNERAHRKVFSLIEKGYDANEAVAAVADEMGWLSDLNESSPSVSPLVQKKREGRICLCDTKGRELNILEQDNGRLSLYPLGCSPDTQGGK